MDQKLLLALCQSNAYANQVLLDTAGKLTEGELTGESSPSHGSIPRLLVHMAHAEAHFLFVCRERPLELDRDELSTLGGVRRFWTQIGEEAQQYLASAHAEGLETELDIPIREKTFRLKKWQLLAQAFVHSAQHRGELSTVLTNLNRPLPRKDIIIWFVEQSGQEWPWPL